MNDPDGHDVEHILGLDLGKASDPSALTVTRGATPWKTGRSWSGKKYGETQYAVVYIHRFDLQTPYPEVVRRTVDVKEAPETGEDPPLVMDATGIGAPVVDRFHEEGLRPRQIFFTSGNEVNADYSARRYGVPKQDLATTVQALLQEGRLTIAEEIDDARILVREMKRFRVKWSDAGHARFEHAAESDTDDILLSVACALWYADQGRPSVPNIVH